MKKSSSLLRRPTVSDGEGLAVVVGIVGALAVYGVLAHLVQDPRIFVDEIRYMDAAGSLADGHGLHTRGEAYGWSPGYPAVLAPILWLAPNRPDAYLWVRLANALFFVLSAVPIYATARRLLSRRAAGLVTVLALIIPSSVYVGLVLTESLAYLTFSVAVFALVLALERPTTLRQAGALLAVVPAYLVRSQFAVLWIAYLVSLVALAVLQAPGNRRETLRRLGPSFISLAAVLVAAAGLLIVRGSSALGRYGDLWRSYDFFAVLRWTAYHVADLGLYLGLFPLLLAPAILASLFQRGSGVSSRRLALLLTLVTATLGTIAIAAAFASTPFGEDRLHDRYIFYVVPLWLVASGVWIGDGARRSWVGVAAGAVLLLGAVGMLPFDRLAADDPWRQLEAAGTPMWSRLGTWTVGHGVSGHRAVGIVALVVLALVLVVPRRFAWVFAVPVAATLVTNAALLWQHGLTASRWHAFGARTDSALAWIDAAVPAGRTVMIADLSSSQCAKYGVAYPLTEFYNDRVGPVGQLSRPADNALPTHWLRLAADGKLIGPSGRPLAAKWVVLAPGLRPEGTPIAHGTREGLVLWRVPGVVAFPSRSEAELTARACRGLQEVRTG